MIRPVTIVVAISIATGTLGALETIGERRRIAVRDGERAVFSEACEHYRVRAGGGSVLRGVPADFVVFLAGTCSAAEASLDRGTRRQRSRAVLLLSRIALLRETVGQMNAERAARAAIRATGTGHPAQFRVTASGEFLIAHRMGLMIAYDAWLDSGVDFSLASDP